MTTIYFVRHAEPDLSQKDEFRRPLTFKGKIDSVRLSEFFREKSVDHIYSSPFRRAVDTVTPLAERYEKQVLVEKDFRERKIDDEWIDHYDEFLYRQWHDFLYRRRNGECLQTVQDRTIAATNMLLIKHVNSSIVVGTHENALGTVIRHYTRQFGFDELSKVRYLRPWIVEFKFNGIDCVDLRDYCLEA